MHVKKDDIPLVAAPLDELWIEFREQPLAAVIWVFSLTPGASFDIESGPTNDPALLGSLVSATLTQKGLVAVTTLPAGGAALTDRFVRVKPTTGRIAVSIAGPLEFRHYMGVLIT